MNNLIIIDDLLCMNELRSLLNKYSNQVKLFLSEEDYNIDLEGLVKQIKNDLSIQKIVSVSTENEILKILIKDILFIETNKNEVFISLANGETHQLDKPFIHYKNNWNQYSIIQVNDNYLVNINSIKEFTLDDNTITLINDNKIKADKSFRNQIIQALKNMEKNINN